MGTARFTPLSRSDLKEIRDFIAQDNPKIAAKYMMLKQKCDLLANSPGLGVCREEYYGLHKFSVDHYLIFYRPSQSGIEVIRILHSNRDVERILKSEQNP